MQTDPVCGLEVHETSANDMNNRIYLIIGQMIILTSILIGIIWARAEGQQDMRGWGVKDPYHKYYDANKFESFKARVLKIKKVVPMPGMSPAVALDVKDGSNIIEVQICPTWFIRPDEIGIKKGDKIVQCVLQKFEPVEIKEVEELSDSMRGEKGFGQADQ